MFCGGVVLVDERDGDGGRDGKGFGIGFGSGVGCCEDGVIETWVAGLAKTEGGPGEGAFERVTWKVGRRASYILMPFNVQR